jgi:hypothetical protein
MEKSLRIEKLNELKEQQPYMTGIRIRYRGIDEVFNVYQIPLEYLIYNKYNGRIGSSVKSFENQYYKLDAENTKHKNKIEEFLWESKKDRNKITETNLVENGQLKFGLVTSDGVIIDGNRRALLLNKIYSEREIWRGKGNDVNKCRFFNAIILPEDADEQEIQRLETTFQMGQDEKLDYNPIEKYLKVKDLKKFGIADEDIAKMMLEDITEIKKITQIIILMDQYLTYLGYDGIYTRLDKTEGPLVDLNAYINRYKGSGCQKVEWDYDIDLDVNEMITLCFDYIRARYEGKEFRLIASPSKNSIFCKSKELWTSFLENHKQTVGSIEEPTVQEIRESRPEEDLSKVLKSRDVDWTENAQNYLKGNLGKAESQLRNLNDADKPLELATRALNAIESINTESEQFFIDEDLLETLCKINTRTFEYMKSIKKYKPNKK